MLKKRYLIVIMIFGLLFLSAANAEGITDSSSDDVNQLSVDGINHEFQSSDLENDLSSIEKGDDSQTGVDEDSSLKSGNVIYFDASASTNGDGSKSNPFKYINHNTLSDRLNSGSEVTAYFADGNYSLNTNFIIRSPNAVFIGAENTRFNSVLSNKYDFEIMANSKLVLTNITFNHVNILNHGNIEAYGARFDNSEAFSGKMAPSIYNSKNCNSSYGGVILCDPVGDLRPYVYLEKCLFANNTAYCGGAMSLINSTLTVKDTEFYLSKSNRKGGLLYALNSNITIINSDSNVGYSGYGGIIYCEKSDVDLRNVNFSFCEAHSFGGVVASKYSNVNVESSYFYVYFSDTDAGGAFYSFKGNLKINNSTFYRGAAEFGGAICNLESNLTILSSYFRNNTAGHGGAVYNIYGKLYIEGNTFLNSSAYTGGVLCNKLSDTAYLINNTFVNSPTRINSSCIYLDACGQDIIQYGNHFEDVFYISQDLFFYVGNEEVTFNSNVLTYVMSNTGKYYGHYPTGDVGGNSNAYGSLKIHDSVYQDNSTVFRNYNDDFNVSFNLNFHAGESHDPMMKIRVYNFFGDIVDELLIYFNENQLNSGIGSVARSLKSHMFITMNSRLTVEMALVSSINSSYSDAGHIPSSYDSRDYGYITPVKDQGEGGNCWAFAGIATLEACIKKATGVTYDFSEENVKNMMAAFSTTGLDIQPNDGGFDSMVMGYLASWYGPVIEETDKYDEFSSLSTGFYPKFHVQNICFLPPRENGAYDYLYKKAIMDYGAVAVTFNVSSKAGLHSISLVGWDDNYWGYDSFGRYAHGAWILKNSWGTDWEDGGFGYLSYNTHFVSDDYSNWYAYSFIFNENDNYMSNIHSDYSGVNNYLREYGPISCSIKVHGPSYIYSRLSAFATYFRVPTDYVIEVYDLNNYNALIFYQEGHSEAGYYTIPLYKTVLVNPGDLILVKVTFNNNGWNYLPVCQAEKLTVAYFKETGHFFYDDGYGGEVDLLDLKRPYDFLYSGTQSNTCQVPSIHLFVNNVMPYETRISVTEFEKVNAGENVRINITFDEIWSITNDYTNTTELIEDSLVTVKINGKAYYALIHDGKASLDIKFDRGGDYTLTAQYKNNKFISNVAGFDFWVKGNSVISAKTVSKIYGGSEKSTITLKDDSGNPIPNMEITYNINGKSTTIKTNAKGQASMDITLAPDTYIATISYGGSDKYSSSKTTAKVIVKKATPKLTAKKKTFKVKKSKKYTVTLKNNKNQAMKNTKVTLTIKNKKYTAKTNNKGVATFKLKINKKGTHKATVKYGGSAYYNAASKKVSIVVKK